MRACPVCGASNGSTDDFCGNCGSYLGWSDSTSPSSTPAEPPAIEYARGAVAFGYAR